MALCLFCFLSALAVECASHWHQCSRVCVYHQSNFVSVRESPRAHFTCSDVMNVSCESSICNNPTSRQYYKMKKKLFNLFYSFFMITSLVIMHPVSSLKIKQLNVPIAVEYGSDVTLVCDFDLEGEILYSVKWYKNLVEFYRFLPSNVPNSATAISMNGVTVEVPRSNSTHVFLAQANLDSEGMYTCEVSTESPSYSTLRAGEIMQVYVLPVDAIEIRGNALNTRLDSGDFINLTCVSPASIPAATLTWFINGQEASNDQLMVYPAQVLTSRLQRQQLGLWLRASSLLFSTSNGIVHLRCTASLILTYEFDSLRTLSYSVSATAAGASSIVPSLTTSSKLHALLPDAHESSSSSSIISYLHSDHHLSESTATITSASKHELSEVNQSSNSHHRINRPLARDDDIQGETQGPQSVRNRGKHFSHPHLTRVSSSIHSSSSSPSPSLSNHHGQQIHHSSSIARRNNRTKQHHQHHQQQQQEKQLHERHLTARSSQLHSGHHEINGNPSAPGNLHRLSASSSSSSSSSFDYNSLPSDRDSGLFFMNSGKSPVETPIRNHPLIDTIEHKAYKIGDWVTINCSTMASNVKLKWYINEVDTSYLSAFEPVTVSQYKQMISEDPDLPNFIMSLRFQLLPSHSGLNEIKLRCVATYTEVIKENAQSLNIFSYNMQAVEAQSTSFTTASSSSSLRPSSLTVALHTLFILLVLHFVLNFPASIYTQSTNNLKLPVATDGKDSASISFRWQEQEQEQEQLVSTVPSVRKKDK